MQHLTLSLFVACLGIFSVWSADITVRGAGLGKDAVRFEGFATADENGKLFLQTLKNDLLRSGWFRIDDAGQITVAGATQSRPGGGITIASRVAWPGRRFDWNGSALTPQETRRLAHRLADDMVRNIKNEVGIASTRITFVNRHGPNDADLYLCDADGRNLMRITHDNVAAVGPRWNRNCTDIFYTSFVSGAPRVYSTPAAGGRRLPLARLPGLNTGAAMSPDGSTIALVLSITGNPEIHTLDRKTGGARRLTNTPHAVEASPAWSPDGSQIVYVCDASGAPQLYILDVATKRSRRLTYKGSENVNPSWSARGLIAYATKRGGSYQIAVIDITVNAEPETTITSGPDHETPSWAPDGRHIVCSRSEGYGRSSLWVLDTKGDNPVRLFANQGNWLSPDWSFK